MNASYFIRLFLIIFSILSINACNDDGPDNPDVNPNPNPNPGTYIQDKDYERDKNLLDNVQKDAFRYIWDFGEPNSGLAYERYPLGNVVTTGGSGFGIAAIVVGADRGFISRKQALDRLLKITGFLLKAEKFNGAFGHWYNPETAKVAPFSANDNGADIVETSFLVEGLLIAREYFTGTGDEERLRNEINQIWQGINWKAFTFGENILYWHCNKNLQKIQDNALKVTGFNECMVTYVMALASQTYSIDRTVYDAWTSGAGYQPKTRNGYTIEAAVDYAGPLFFTHYSFIGLDGKRMGDSFVKKGYFVRNTTHVMINRAYCLETAPEENRYSETDWGLTASYGTNGYSAHSPKNDRAVIAPTAALSSMPYTPYYSMQVLRNLRTKSSEYWGTYGPYDAYSLKDNWISTDRYLAIDQLPIVCMIENYRTGLLWNLFMKAPEIQSALSKAGITEPVYESGFHLSVPLLKNGVSDALDIVRHPDTGKYAVPFYVKTAGEITFSFINSGLETVNTVTVQAKQGENILEFEKTENVNSGKFILSFKADGKVANLNIRLN